MHRRRGTARGRQCVARRNRGRHDGKARIMGRFAPEGYEKCGAEALATTIAAAGAAGAAGRATGESPPLLASTACLPHDRHLHPPNPPLAERLSPCGQRRPAPRAGHGEPQPRKAGLKGQAWRSSGPRTAAVGGGRCWVGFAVQSGAPARPGLRVRSAPHLGAKGCPAIGVRPARSNPQRAAVMCSDRLSFVVDAKGRCDPCRRWRRAPDAIDGA
jgi:hypothetical protein